MSSEKRARHTDARCSSFAPRPSRLTSNCAMPVPCGAWNGTSKVQRCAESTRCAPPCSGSEAACSKVVRAIAPSVALSRRSAVSCGGVSGMIVAGAGCCAESGAPRYGGGGPPFEAACSAGIWPCSAAATVFARLVACSGDSGAVAGSGSRSSVAPASALASCRMLAASDKGCRAVSAWAGALGSGSVARGGAVSPLHTLSTSRNTISAAFRSADGVGASRGGCALQSRSRAALRRHLRFQQHARAHERLLHVGGAQLFTERDAQREQLLRGCLHGRRQRGRLHGLFDVGEQRRETALPRRGARTASPSACCGVTVARRFGRPRRRERRGIANRWGVADDRRMMNHGCIARERHCERRLRRCTGRRAGDDDRLAHRMLAGDALRRRACGRWRRRAGGRRRCGRLGVVRINHQPRVRAGAFRGRP